MPLLLTHYFHHLQFTHPPKPFKHPRHEITLIQNQKPKTLKPNQPPPQLTLHPSIHNLKPQHFHPLLIPAPFSPHILPPHHPYLQFTKPFIHHKKPLFPISHPPQFLITPNTLQGRAPTPYTSIQLDMQNPPPKFKHQQLLLSHHHLLTTPTPHHIPPFNPQSLKLLPK
nr:DJ-1/PfpI family protein [Bacillus altitudinis]